MDEYDETFELNLTNAVNATLADGQGIGTIEDSDDLVVATSDYSAYEFFGTVDVWVWLSVPSVKTITVDFASADGSAVSPAGVALLRCTQRSSGMAV